MRHLIPITTMIALAAIAGCDQTKPKGGAAAPAATARDNTAVNDRDKSAAVKTPIDQNENQRDIDITANIRKRVVDTKLSVNATNVKIITQDGKVTLRGPVKSDAEKKQIETIANDVAGAGNVDSQLEIQP
jgi:hyperosmotically inducible periplasmic protein